MGGLYGKYYSELLSTTEAGEDLITKLKTSLGVSRMTVKKLTLICSTEIHVDVNSTGVYSDLWLDTDSTYRLSLDGNDVLISTLLVEEESISDIFVAVIYG